MSVNANMLDGGSIVWVTCTFGGQNKIRPAIVVDGEDGMYQVILGTTQMWDERKHSLEISIPSEMSLLGIQKPTRFEMCRGTMKWLPPEAIIKVTGSLSKSMKQRLGLAFLEARFQRMI